MCAGVKVRDYSFALPEVQMARVGGLALQRCRAAKRAHESRCVFSSHGYHCNHTHGHKHFNTSWTASTGAGHSLPLARAHVPGCDHTHTHTRSRVWLLDGAAGNLGHSCRASQQYIGGFQRPFCACLAAERHPLQVHRRFP
jgi:hypothetical protein